MLSHVQLFEIPWTVAHQAPLFMGFPRQEDWSGLPFPSPRGLPDPGIGLASFASPALKMKVAQSCPTLCNPVDYTVHGILQARILEWVAFPFPRRSSQPRDRTQVSHIASGFFTNWATREVLHLPNLIVNRIAFIQCKLNSGRLFHWRCRNIFNTSFSQHQGEKGKSI